MAAKIPGNGIDANGQEIILDADGDTSITVSTDDQIDFKIAGADDFTVTANTFNIASGSKIAYGDGGSTSSLMGETWRYTASASLSGGDDQNIATNLERADDTATGHLHFQEQVFIGFTFRRICIQLTKEQQLILAQKL